MNKKEEYSVRRKAAEDLHAEMEARGKSREARKARLLVDSLDLFYSDVAGGYGASPVDLTNPYVREDYDVARAQIMAYLKGGGMPWIKNRPTRKEEEQARKQASLRLSLGTPADKRPLAMEMKIDLTQRHDRRKTRSQFNKWRDWGNITAYTTTSTGKTFKFDGIMTLTQGKYMVRSRDGRHLAIEDMLLEPEQFEPRLAELGINFERRSSGHAWDGYINK